MEEKKNTGLKISLVIFIVLTLCLAGYIIYDKVLSNESINNEESENNVILEMNDIKVIKKYDTNNQVTKGYVYFKEKLINESMGEIGNVNIFNPSNIYIVTYTEMMSQSGIQKPLFITKNGDLIEIPCENNKDLIKINNENIETEIIGIILDQNGIDIYKTCSGCVSLEQAKPYGYKYSYKIDNDKLIETNKEEISSSQTISDIYASNRKDNKNITEYDTTINEDILGTYYNSDDNNNYFTLKSNNIADIASVDCNTGNVILKNNVSYRTITKNEAIILEIDINDNKEFNRHMIGSRFSGDGSNYRFQSTVNGCNDTENTYYIKK